MDELKKTFNEHLKEINLKRMKVALTLGGVVTWLFFWILDLVAVPQFAFLFLKFRLYGALICLLGFIFISLPWFRNFAKKHIEVIIYISFINIAFFIALMIRYYGGYVSPYYAGILMVLLLYPIAVVSNPFLTFLVTLTMILMYIIPSVLIDKIPDFRLFFTNCFFLIGGSSLGSIISVINYHQQYRVFVLNRNMEEKNRKLMELDQLKLKFFNNITHELRTPLTLITTPLDNLLSFESNVPDHIRQQLETMQTNALRLIKLINTVLDLSKLEAKAMKLNIRKESFTGFIEYLTNSFDSMVKQKNINLLFKKDAASIEFPFDKEKVENIFVNLIFNAIKFTPQGGNITIKAGEKNNYAFISIQDTGIGIKKEYIPIIFDRFTQIGDPMKKEYSGTGIGLAIVKELVELHKGKITVESYEGKGSDFTVYIPTNLQEDTEDPEALEEDKEDITKKIARKALYAEDAGIKKIIPMPQRKESSENKLATVLAIDDNQDMLSVINETLKNNYTVLCVDNSIEALKLAPEMHPDIIVSDLMMPHIDGLELCQMLKKDPRTNRIPFILLTAKADFSDRIKGLELGLDDYLFKPFHPAELKARISSMLRIKRLSDELNTKKEKLEELNLTLQDLAIKDPLTGILNRRHLFNFLEQIIEQKKNNTFGLIILDIDYFKIFNDTNGHLAGDSALKKIVDIMQSVIKNTGKIFRYGGEEFIIFLPDKNKTESLNIAEITRKAVENEKIRGEENLPEKKLTISLGAGAYPENGKTIDQLLSNIDNALYLAKTKRNASQLA